MKLRVLNCEKIENGKYSVEIEYTEGSERFYPDGKGGQIGDLGKVGEAKILVSQEKNLVLDRELIPGEYCYEIDGERRRDAEENHSGEHLFSALAFLKYGWRTVGFKMSEKYCTLDFDRNDMTPEMIAQLEGDVNTKICEGHNLREEICNIEKANSLMGERKDVAAKITGDIRMVSTFPEDFNACAGLHVKNTKDIKMFKILSWEKVKSSCMRFYFISGDRCFRDYSEKHEIVKELNGKFSSQTGELLTLINKQSEDKKELEKKMRVLTQKYGELLLQKILNNSEKVTLLEAESDLCETVKKIFLEKKLENRIFVGVDEEMMIIASVDKDMQTLFKNIQKKIELKGGGSKNSVVIKFQKGKKNEVLDSVMKEFSNLN
ncbi:MAG: hypothetical protein ACRCTS_01280 [Fusobacteriaceae bacterium]